MSERATPAPSASDNGSPADHQTDSLFDPSVEMMVNDFDDERTMEEEEALAATESQDPTVELTNLERESNMPIDELLALYNCKPIDGDHRLTSRRRRGQPTKGKDESEVNKRSPHQSGKKKIKFDEDDDNLSLKVLADITDRQADSSNDDGSDREPDDSDDEAISSALLKLYPDVSIRKNVEAIRSLVNADDDEDIDDDEEDDGEGRTSQDNGGRRRLTKRHSLTNNLYHLQQQRFHSHQYQSYQYHMEQQRLLRALPRHSDDDDDPDYSFDEEDFKKTIMVGSEFQAPIPDGLCTYDDALPYENEDKLMWDPNVLSIDQVEDYLKSAIKPADYSNLVNLLRSPTTVQPEQTGDETDVKIEGTNQGIDETEMDLDQQSNVTNSNLIDWPNGKHLRDDEQSLHLLLQCGYNIEEALRRLRIQLRPSTNPELNVWSEEECRNFENGLRTYGKDFHTVQQCKVRTRSVSELVQFYYLWKKSERHDCFAHKARLDKKKYNLHPGMTDYMDRFLDEQENNGIGTGSNHSTASSTVVGTGTVPDTDPIAENSARNE